jgi:hypothetical protein
MMGGSMYHRCAVSQDCDWALAIKSSEYKHINLAWRLLKAYGELRPVGQRHFPKA